MSGKGKVDQHTYEARVREVIGWICQGWPTTKILPHITELWGVEVRQGRNYVRAARRRIAALHKHKLKYMAEEMFARHDDLRGRAYEDRDYRFILDVDKEDAKLLGLYPAEKHEHDIRGIDDAIARELARLAGESEAGATD